MGLPTARGPSRWIFAAIAGVMVLAAVVGFIAMR